MIRLTSIVKINSTKVALIVNHGRTHTQDPDVKHITAVEVLTPRLLWCRSLDDPAFYVAAPPTVHRLTPLEQTLKTQQISAMTVAVCRCHGLVAGWTTMDNHVRDSNPRVGAA